MILQNKKYNHLTIDQQLINNLFNRNTHCKFISIQKIIITQNCIYKNVFILLKSLSNALKVVLIHV